ncbi:hypothetical protein WT81_32485 [Burkholderia stagnalis]|nr:hypothetical protein WT80_23945 [Burkholderia stagnalis]KWK48199.1 hypothetical protein WT81_32485 [Burkholderia stagnalis]
MVLQVLSHPWQVVYRLDTDATQFFCIANARQHQQVCASNCPTAHNDLPLGLRLNVLAIMNILNAEATVVFDHQFLDRRVRSDRQIASSERRHEKRTRCGLALSVLDRQLAVADSFD